jgi:para-aminobenzoate synthetase component 1
VTRPQIIEARTSISPEGLIRCLGPAGGAVLLRSAHFESRQARYSFVTANPFLLFRSFGSRCETVIAGQTRLYYGNPWHLLDSLMTQFELIEEPDLPFPLGGCFGFWGYDLKNFVEPRLSHHAVNDLDLPECHVGFYSSLVVFDHRLGRVWIISTGLEHDGSRSDCKCLDELEFWQMQLESDLPSPAIPTSTASPAFASNLSREAFIQKVDLARNYIRRGHIYQVNLSHRLCSPWTQTGWNLFLRLKEASPAPYAAYLHCGDFEIASSSPEMFLRMSGAQIQTRPIKGTRPRSADPTRDSQLGYELQTSPKENAELVMITDLLRNDLGKVCEYGTVHVPELVRLEKYPQVQHLVSTVEGRLRPNVTHFAALASSFPGGSITGAPKVRAMEIIDELEPTSRGPYTGALGYLGFNRESQLSILIRSAVCKDATAYFNVGAGIVADSDPVAEWEETLSKGQGFVSALSFKSRETATSRS